MPIESYRKLSDLPSRLPIFPLAGALLFPRWSLPLNIFEPRYLNMIDDALSSRRLIGMIQPAAQGETQPAVSATGCAGRITSYSETDDGRYLISLTGVCRFSIHEELALEQPYRRVRPNWEPYLDDLQKPTNDVPFDRDALTRSLKRYTENHAMEVDWDAVEHAHLETLIHALCAGCPFGSVEKQALLEAKTIEARAETLMALLDMDMPGEDSSTVQ